MISKHTLFTHGFPPIIIGPLRSLFQLSDDEEETSVYASFVTVSSEQTGTVSANMADNNYDNDLHRRMEAQEQTSKAQQVILDNIQQMLAQLLNNQNNDETTSSNHVRRMPAQNPLRLKVKRKFCN